MDLLNTVSCMDALSLMAQLDDGSIDMALTSPPYDNLRTYNGHSEFDFEGIAQETYRVLKPGGVLVWIVGDATIDGCETLTPMRQALYFVDAVGFKMHDTMIWTKNSPPGKFNRYTPGFDYMFVLAKGAIKCFNPIKCKSVAAGRLNRKQHSGKHGRGFNNSYARMTSYRQPAYRVLYNYWYVTVGYSMTSKDKESHNHPAMFPEKLAERHILTWSNPGDTVLDYFMGSGTTAKMARNNGRHYIGCDINAEYVELANKRLAKPYTLPMFNEQPTQAQQATQLDMFAEEGDN